MNDITITEKYALCTLKEKRNFYENELAAHLLVSMIIEMMLNGNLKISDKSKVKLTDTVPEENYNIQLYNAIKDRKFNGILKRSDEIPFKDIITLACYSFSNKTIKSIVEPLKEKMVQDNLISLEEKKGLLGNKEVVVIDENKFNNVVEEIRAEILEMGKLTDDIILLSSLLNSTKFLKNIFTKYEEEKLNIRLKEMKQTEISEKVKIAQDVINDMSAIMAAVVVTTMN
jgi:hypothetical protein